MLKKSRGRIANDAPSVYEPKITDSGKQADLRSDYESLFPIAHLTHIGCCAYSSSSSTP